MKKVLVSAGELSELVSRIFTARGMAPSHAARVAEVLVWADLAGHGSHGVSRVERYLGFAERGDIDLRAIPQNIGSVGAVSRWDGRSAAGAVAVIEALPDVSSKAKAYGISLLLVSNTTHIGAAGYYAGRLAAEGLIGMVMAAGGPLMSYHGTAGAAVSTAPFSIAAPGPDGPLVLDMASSNAALGKIRQAAAAGNSIPADWGLDENGAPTTNPDAVATLRPLGGPKGSGLALMIEVIASLLPAAPILAAALEPGAPKRHRQNVAIIAIDIEKCQPLGDFSKLTDELISALKTQPREQGTEAIRMPGERSATTAAERMKDGIPLAASLLERLRALATG